MGGIASTLQIAKGALAAQQYGINVTGNNIANVSNPDYSMQKIQLVNNQPVSYAGFLFGSGVDLTQIQQSVDQLLENRLTDKKADLSAYQEAETYITLITDYFSESSDTSLSRVLTDFWNSWSDLSNDPADSAQRLGVLENTEDLSERFNMASAYLDQLSTDLTLEMDDAVNRINQITGEIATLNKEITGQEVKNPSNDNRDKRNALLDELGELIDIDTFEQSSGAVVVNVANGLPIVNNQTTYDLSVADGEIIWNNSSGGKNVITDKITAGQIGGWLEIRDEVIPKYSAELDELAGEFIWALNYQHTQGAGLEYFSDTLTGDYVVDETGLLSSLSFGNKIDYTGDLSVWIEDTTAVETVYTQSQMDMGISEASISNWKAGSGLPEMEAVYKLTVMDGAHIGNKLVAETDGGNDFSKVQASATSDVDSLLDSALAEQTLKIYGGPSGTQVVNIKAAGGDAIQSAASIADYLNGVSGLIAYASETRVTFDTANVSNALTSGTEVSFSLYVDGITEDVVFEVDNSLGYIQEQFEDALLSAVESINRINGDQDLSLEYDVENASNTEFTLVSRSGKTVGMEDFNTGNDTDFIVFSGNGTSADIFEQGDITGEAKSAVITGTVTTLMDPGMSIFSSAAAVDGGLFLEGSASTGSSILTFGGEGGFENLDSIGDQISFDISGTDVNGGAPVTVTYTAAADNLTDLEHADALFTLLEAALINPADPDPPYKIIQSGSSVSILKASDLTEPIEIGDFHQDAGGVNARLKVATGTGSGTSAPDNDFLEHWDSVTLIGNQYSNSATSSLYADEGVIMWEKYYKNGISTGEWGLIEVEDEGPVSILDQNDREILTFDISAGTLVAGNTLSLNINEDGSPDPLIMKVKGSAISQNDIYTFKILSGGSVNSLPIDNGEPVQPIVVEWNNGSASGSFEIEASDPPYSEEMPAQVEVDGMTLNFFSGTVFDGDVFTISTDESGNPVSANEDGTATGETLSDWHWTMDSFVDEFNRQIQGMTADATNDGRLTLAASDTYHVMTNEMYSNENGFTPENITMEIKNWDAIDFEASNLRFELFGGEWKIENDPTGNAVIIPEGGDMDGFGVDFNEDGVADIEFSFAEKVSEDVPGPDTSFFSFDLKKHDSDNIGFAFSESSGGESGLFAATGINTLLKGNSALTMSLNEELKDTKFLAAASIDSDTGQISAGDNYNALAMADLQFERFSIRQWTFTSDGRAISNLTEATLDGYYNTMIGSLGTEAKNIKSSSEFASLMVNYITEQRDSVSAVSLDEEMIKLIEYQSAFQAAAKLVTVSDEMLNTILGMR